MTVGERDGNAALRRATTILLEQKLRAFDTSGRRWRSSADLRAALFSLVPVPRAVQVREDGEYLYGAPLDVDRTAPEWTLELEAQS